MKMKRFYHHGFIKNDATSLLFNIKQVQTNPKHLIDLDPAIQLNVLKALPKSWFQLTTLNQLDQLSINDLLFCEFFKHIPFYILYPHQKWITWSPHDYSHHYQLHCHAVYKVKIKKLNQSIVIVPFGIQCEWELIDDKNYYTSFNLL
jgi:hypothetical protein